MKKIKQLNGMVIAQDKAGDYAVFTKDEWSQGEGYRYPEFDGITNLAEAEEQARNY